MKRTVIVTGAGASMPYGFPSGAELRDAIFKCWSLKAESSNAHRLGSNPLYRYARGDRSALLDHPDFQSFRQHLRRQELGSVDRFLEMPRNERFIEVGLLSTALVIGSCHHSRHFELQLPSGQWRSHWYRGFIDLMGDDLKPKALDLKIVTFNYDVSLETYLCQVLASRTGLDEGAVWKKLSKQFGFLHVYGSVSPPWTDSLFDEFRDDPEAWAKQAAARLKIIAQGRDDDPNFEVAKDWISSAETVCFYGFGYDATNVERLGVYGQSELLEGKNVFGTFVGRPSPPPHVRPVHPDNFWNAVQLRD